MDNSKAKIQNSKGEFYLCGIYINAAAFIV